MTERNRQLPTATAPGLLPKGDYRARVMESAVLPTASGKGEMLKLTFEIGAGPFAGRRVSDWLNIVNDHAVAQRIAQERLARLCAAAGLSGIADSDELHGIAVIARVDIRAGSDGFADRNVIKDYRPLLAAASRAVATGRRPWDS